MIRRGLENFKDEQLDVLDAVVAIQLIELLFVFVEAVFVAPRSEELGIAT